CDRWGETLAQPPLRLQTELSAGSGVAMSANNRPAIRSRRTVRVTVVYLIHIALLAVFAIEVLHLPVFYAKSGAPDCQRPVWLSRSTRWRDHVPISDPTRNGEFWPTH